MKLQYLPEGLLLDTNENVRNCQSVATLRTAKLLGTVLEGIAIRCDTAHNLIIQCGPFRGIIPREACATGIAEGTTKEVAILSRVGKPVAFCIEEVTERDGGLLLLGSRKKAQQSALDMLLETARPGMVLPAVVTHLEPFGTFVDLGCGVVSMIPIEHSSISRIGHPIERFFVGQSIFVLVTEVNRMLGRLSLSHKELLGTWAENAALFSVGEIVTGFVRGVMDYGVFIELAPNLTGLADACPHLLPGDRVSTYIKAILPENRKIKLRVMEVLPDLKSPPSLHYFVSGGMLFNWNYEA